MDLVEAPARQNAAAGAETGMGKSGMVKKINKAGRGKKPTTTPKTTTAANSPLAHHPTASHSPTTSIHQAEQPTAVTAPPLSQVTASRLGLEILNNSAMGKYQASALVVDVKAAKSITGAGGGIVRTQNQNQKQDWLRPDTVTSTAEDDRLVATQTHLLKRRLDMMREDAEKGVSANAKEQREGGEQKPSLSVGEALTMGRAGSKMDHLKERLECNLLERERLLKQFQEL